MKKIKVLSIFGTRPEAIKMAPLVKELEKRKEIDSKVLVTAQHREMLDQVMDIFEIAPDFDLNLMKHGQTITDITSGVLKGTEKVLEEFKPDIVLVHGDTTTTFSAALAAFYQKISVGHVEAGLRTGNVYSPYPEEMNRLLTGRLATFHYAPTKLNRENLLKENIEENVIIVTGNTVIDALYKVSEKPYEFQDEALNSIDYENEKVILLTCHRRENWGQPMENIFTAIKQVAVKYPDVQVVFPMHKNPLVRDIAQRIMGETTNIKLIEPLEYQPFAKLMNKSHIILTDSGGIQEEAPGLGKPVIVLRTETERPEAVEAGTVKVAGVETETVFQMVCQLLDSEKTYNEMSKANNPYGDGKASIRIVDHIIQSFS